MRMLTNSLQLRMRLVIMVFTMAVGAEPYAPLYLGHDALPRPIRHLNPTRLRLALGVDVVEIDAAWIIF